MSFQLATRNGHNESAEYVARKRLRHDVHTSRTERRQKSYYTWYERECLKQSPDETARPVKIRAPVPPSGELPEAAEERLLAEDAERRARQMARQQAQPQRTDQAVLASRSKDGILGIDAYKMMRRKNREPVHVAGRPELICEMVARKEETDLARVDGTAAASAAAQRAASRRSRRSDRPWNVTLQDEPGAFRGVLQTSAYSTMVGSLQRRGRELGPAGEKALNNRLSFFVSENKEKAQKQLGMLAGTMAVSGKLRAKLPKRDGSGSAAAAASAST